MERIMFRIRIHQQQHIKPCVQVCFYVTIRFTTVTLGTIALHSVTEATGKRKTDSVVMQIVGHIKQFCPAHADPLPIFEQMFYVYRALYPLLTGKALSM